jgi:hypothetical protein
MPAYLGHEREGEVRGRRRSVLKECAVPLMTTREEAGHLECHSWRALGKYNLPLHKSGRMGDEGASNSSSETEKRVRCGLPMIQVRGTIQQLAHAQSIDMCIGIKLTWF